MKMFLRTQQHRAEYVQYAPLQCLLRSSPYSACTTYPNDWSTQRQTFRHPFPRHNAFLSGPSSRRSKGSGTNRLKHSSVERGSWMSRWRTGDGGCYMVGMRDGRNRSRMLGYLYVLLSFSRSSIHHHHHIIPQYAPGRVYEVVSAMSRSQQKPSRFKTRLPRVGQNYSESTFSAFRTSCRTSRSSPR